MKFNSDAFIRALTKLSGRQLVGSQIEGFTFLLNRISTDSRWQTIGQIAYFLATAWHETAYTMHPITERGGLSYFAKYDGRATLGNNQPGDGYKFRGRGYVQNTGRKNAGLTGKALAGHYYPGIDGPVSQKTFTDFPQFLLIPEVSYDDAVDAMLTGRYTGVSLQRFVNARQSDYVKARKVINGTDCAPKIAGYARNFEACLRATQVAPSQPLTPVADKPASALDQIKERNKAATSNDDNVSLSDVTDKLKDNVSTESLKSIGMKLAAKLGAPIIALWGAGVHGKLIVILISAVVVGVGGYEVRKHRARISQFIKKAVKGQ